MKRLLRIIEYYGDDEFIQAQIENRSVKGTKLLQLLYNRKALIREAIVGEVPQLLNSQELEEIENRIIQLKKEEDAKNK